MAKKEDERKHGSDDEESEDSGEDEEEEEGEEDSGESGSEEEMSESESEEEAKSTKQGSKGSSSAPSAAAQAHSSSAAGTTESKVSSSGKDAGGNSGATKSDKERSLANQPFDEAVDLSESEGSGSDGKESPKKSGKQLKNQPFDEALELSGSMQEIDSPKAKTREEQPSKPLVASTPATSAAKPQPLTTSSSELKNKPFDEEEVVSDSAESVDTVGQPSPDNKTAKAKATAKATPTATEPPPKRTEKAEEKAQKPNADDRKATPAAAVGKSPTAPGSSNSSGIGGGAGKTNKTNKHEESSSESEEEDEEMVEQGRSPPKETARKPNAATTSAPSIHSAAGGYKESDFAHLKVSNDVRELFQYIGRFKAQEIELETRLKCFIPEYIPAVGDMDAFLKIPRPDGEMDQLGLRMLDEPSLNQSDATVLDLQLRSTSKKKHGDLVVRSIENAEKSPKEIDRWIKSIADLHRTKPPPQVHYTKTMPDIESLMQVWPEEFEELLSRTPLPNASMDMSLEQYIRVICAILDVPVYKNIYESLHLLFTLYLEFRSNQHFMNFEQAGNTNPSGSSTTAEAIATDGTAGGSIDESTPGGRPLSRNATPSDSASEDLQSFRK